jgi:hypothetical protein
MVDLSFDHLVLKPEDVDFVIYHDPCPDGFSSAVSAWHYLSNKFPEREVMYHGTNYGRAVPDVTGKNVVICDFSYKKDILAKLKAQANKLIIIDHHETAEADLLDFSNENKLFRMDHSGAYLTWRYFHFDKPVPRFIEYIEDHDIWTKKLPLTDEFSSFVSTLPFKFEEYSKLFDDEYLDTVVFPLGKGMVIQNNIYIDQTVRKAIPRFMMIHGKYYFVIHLHSSVLRSEIGNKSLLEFLHANFTTIFSHDPYYGSTTFSLRSTSEQSNSANIARCLIIYSK